MPCALNPAVPVLGVPYVLGVKPLRRHGRFCYFHDLIVVVCAHSGFVVGIHLRCADLLIKFGEQHVLTGGFKVAESHADKPHWSGFVRIAREFVSHGTQGCFVIGGVEQ